MKKTGTLPAYCTGGDMVLDCVVLAAMLISRRLLYATASFGRKNWPSSAPATHPPYTRSRLGGSVTFMRETTYRTSGV